MTAGLGARIAASIDRPIHPAVAELAANLGREAGALAVLFYGSNLRTGSLEGVLDFYLLLPGEPEKGIWPRVSYIERGHGALMLRAKIANMRLATFEQAASGGTIDTTIWARFVQPSALAWYDGGAARLRVLGALEQAAITAARLAVTVGPVAAPEEAFWRALFRATYRAELRVEKPGREESIIAAHAAHFDGLLPAALTQARIGYTQKDGLIRPGMPPAMRRRVLAWWYRRRRLGRPLNVVRLLRATSTFDGAARYAAWKVERHTGMNIPLTPFRERHPVLAAPSLLWSLWRAGRVR